MDTDKDLKEKIKQIAHAMGQPLMAINGYTEMLLMESDVNERSLNKILTNAERLNALVIELQFLARD